MNEKIDWKNIDTKELAGLIYQHFKRDGIEVILLLRAGSFLNF